MCVCVSILHQPATMVYRDQRETEGHSTRERNTHTHLLFRCDTNKQNKQTKKHLFVSTYYTQLTQHTHTHNKQIRKTIRPPELAKREELNATKIAIKFSTLLNKDMVFSGLRDFVIRIGEAVASGQQVAIAFSLGVLHASERKVTFAFDPEVTNTTTTIQKQQQSNKILQESIEKEKNEKEGLVKENKEEENVMVEEEEENEEPIVPETQDEVVLQQQQQQQQLLHDSFGGLSIMPSERSVPSDIVGLETSGVVEQAYRRYLQDVQQRVEEAAFEKERFVRQVKEERDEAEKRKMERKQSNLELQDYLKSQISRRDVQQERLTLERRKDGLCSFPPLLNAKSNDNIFRQNIKNEKKHQVELREALMSQMRYKEEARRNERAKQIEDEREFVNQIKSRMMENKIKLQLKRLERKDKLLQAWDREAQLKSLLKRGIDIHSRIDVGDDDDDYSVGYDMR